MSEKNLINHNGSLIDGAAPALMVSNRAFRYGDGIFESIRLWEGQMPLFHLHFRRLMESAQIIKLKLPKQQDEDFFKQEILKLAEAKGVGRNARIRLCLYRKDGGAYEPVSSTAEFLIEAEGKKEKLFEPGEEGLTIDLYSEMEKPATRLSNIKSCNALVYVLAALYRKEHKLDDCLLINNKGRVIEAIESNIFLVEEGTVVTPPLAEGCVDGVMRAYVMQLMEQEGIAVHESPIVLEQLFSAREIFFTNAIRGIRSVRRYKSREYGNSFTRKIQHLLLESLGDGDHETLLSRAKA